jgi:hypothetical protein
MPPHTLATTNFGLIAAFPLGLRELLEIMTGTALPPVLVNNTPGGNPHVHNDNQAIQHQQSYPTKNNTTSQTPSLSSRDINTIIFYNWVLNGKVSSLGNLQ